MSSRLEAGYFFLFPAMVVRALLLAGPIPPELGHLAALERLSLRDNQLSGESLTYVFVVPLTNFA